MPENAVTMEDGAAVVVVVVAVAVAAVAAEVAVASGEETILI